jgi:diguanylate cyclase (GGDEF)-like protein
MNKLLALLRPSPATRVAAGLVSLMVMLILGVDLFTGILPDRVGEARRLRTDSALALTTQVNAALRQDRGADLQAVLTAAARHDPLLQSVAVRTVAGELLAQVGDHEHHWHLAADEPSTLDNVRMPILADGRPWGEVQLGFGPALPQTLGGWLCDPLVLGIVLLTVAGFGVFQLYLRRVLRYLDPNSAVPERVRTAFDTLSEGVLVLDRAGNIMLINRTLRSLHPGITDDLIGTRAAALGWIVGSLPPAPEPPWALAVRDNRPRLGYRLRVEATGAEPRELVMNCSPISDGSGRVRGCLASFSDVTELHQRTEHLRVALDELNASKREIERKNEELTLQAMRDPLTGCLNRRALMQEGERCVERARRNAEALCCIMCDIDHFKSVNDQFGHAAGDVVIQAAVKSLSRCLRLGDLLGRYGGEEFCVVLPAASLVQALEVAERLRAEVEANVAAALRQPSRPKVTMSFGVALWTPEVAGPAELIDRADQALYQSKQHGRNRVMAWAARPQQAETA